MKVMAQVGMVMNLDKCIGCHTCSVTCKQAWTNRAGTEYVWFNNVETRPGQGYPRRYEDQEKWRGGWELNRRGRLKLKGGGRLKKLFGIFASPVQPELDDYYEPWTYDYETLTDAPLGDDFPVARPKSLITGNDMKVEWSANWDDNLGGTSQLGHLDPIVEKIRKESEDKIKFEFEQTFMFYLPRICEHCLNPSCMASCPSGAIYKREEDGIVLVDQDRCRGWRQCITGCPYKKMYFNHKTGKAEKCTFCYPRIEVGIPTVCSETCVGRLRYIGIFLYDADRVTEAASIEDEKELYQAQLDLMLDPNDPEVIAGARAEGIPEDWMDAARRSPVYNMAKVYKVALPLHPEYRTMPMVWYVPPLSPVVDLLSEQGHDAEDAGNLFGAIDSLRIPVEYLAELFTAGDTEIVTGVLRKLAAMRSFMRGISLGNDPDDSIPEAVGMEPEAMYEMYRLMAIAKYNERYVIPKAHVEQAHNLEEMGCSLDFDDGPGMYPSDPFGEASGKPTPVAVENFYALKQRQTTDGQTEPGELRGRVNLLNWDGRGVPRGLFPKTEDNPQMSPDSPAHGGGAAGPGPDYGGPSSQAGPSGNPAGEPTTPGAMMQRQRVTYLAASWCLGYPDEELLERMPLIRSALAEFNGLEGAFDDVLNALTARPLAEVQAWYVQEFDLSKRHALHLSYWTDGDTRRRGEVLIGFKQVYRDSGMLVNTHGELPDYLPMVLEFAATVDMAAGRELLIQYRPSLEMLRLALVDDSLPHAQVLQAVCDTLPGASPTDRQEVMKMAGYGPPTETVGLEPYDPRLLPMQGGQ